jgi:hypothetical protein
MEGSRDMARCCSPNEKAPAGALSRSPFTGDPTPVAWIIANIHHNELQVKYTSGNGGQRRYRQIDRLVYELYALTDDEIRIVKEVPR